MKLAFVLLMSALALVLAVFVMAIVSAWAPSEQLTETIVLTLLLAGFLSVAGFASGAGTR